MKGRSNGVGWASVEATAAGAAVVALGGVGFEVEGGKYLGKEDPIAVAAADEIGVLANEAEAGALGNVTLEDGAGIDVPQGASSGDVLIDKVSKTAKGRGENVVIIVEAGVTGDDALSGADGGICVKMIIKSEGNHGLG